MDCSIEELITVDLSETFKDGELGFTGLATGGLAATYISGIPLAAMELAKKTHAPNLTTLLSGWIFNPDLNNLEGLPDSEYDNYMMDIPCEAYMVEYPGSWSHKAGDISFGFGSGAQVDQRGNINSSHIGNQSAPKAQLVGPIFLPEHMAHFGREYIMMPKHETKNFVKKVDYISGVGFRENKKYRQENGLTGTGPTKVYTPKCIFAFKESGNIYVKSIHPGILKEDIVDNTGFDVGSLEDVPTTKFPTQKQLKILREDVDPKNILLKI